MPRYDTLCPLCGFAQEVTRGMNAVNPPCGKCGGKVDQLPSLTSFVLKGGGWGKDGYGKGK